MNKILRFIGAIILAYLFSLIWSSSCICIWASIVWLFSDFTFGRFFMMSVGWSIATYILTFILPLIGMGMTYVIKGSKLIAALPIMMFLMNVLSDIMSFILIDKGVSKPVTAELMGMLSDISGIWYNIGAFMTSIVMIIGYVVMVSIILVYDGQD